MYKTKRKLLSIGIAISLASTTAQAYAEETITIQAESFVNTDGTFNDGQSNAVTIYSVNGQQAINYVNAGDYVDYTVNAIGGEYTIEYLVGTSVAANPGIEVLVNSSGVFQSQGAAIVPLGSWDDFQPLSATHKVVLPAGTSTIRLLAVGPDWQWNLESFSLTGGTDSSDGGSPGQVDNIVVNLENFIFTNKDGAAIGGDSVVGFNSANGGINFNTSGDYADYEVTFTEAGTYSATLAAGSPVTGQLGAEIIIDNFSVATAYLSTTGGWDNYSNFDLNGDIVIPYAGTYTVRLKSLGSAAWQWNGDTLTFNHQSSDTGGGSNISVTGVSVTPSNSALNIGQSQTVNATISPANATNANVQFTSSNNNIATVDANGNVTAINSGQAIITVSTIDGGYTAQTNITVLADGISVTGVSMNPASTTLDVGQSQTVTTTVSPTDATNDAVSYYSSDSAVATVNGYGQITAIAAGQATITVTTSDGNFTAMTTVTVSPQDTGGGGEPGEGFEHNGNGLLWGRVDGAENFRGNQGYIQDSPNYKVTTDLLETDDAIRANSTEVFRGKIYDADGHISFYENIDDSVRLYIDGVLVLSNDSWENTSQTSDLNLTPGTHDFELRLGNADGGSGAVSGIGFGIDVDGGTNFVHPSALANNIFTSNGQVIVDPILPPPGGIVIELENFDATGTTGRVASDPNDGFVAETGATNVSWVTNGDYGDYYNIYLEAGTYRSFITVATGNDGSYGARIDLNGSPVSWGYFDSTGGWESPVENELYGGDFIVESSGSYTIRVEAIGGSDWQWSGDNVRLAKVSDVNVRPTPIYNPNDHVVSEIEVPLPGLKYLKTPVSIPVANQVKKSEVWYTYPQNIEEAGYEDFRATGAFWGHPPEEDFYEEETINDWVGLVQLYENMGLKYNARGEFDWGFRWFTEYVTDSEPHYVRTLDDRMVRMTFMGYLSHNGYNNNWLSNHSPAFVPFFKSQVDQLLKANPSHLMFDTQTSSTRATDMRTFGGDFNEYAMENFRIWLDKKYSSADLAAMGVSNVQNFDYKQHLLNAGVTHATFSAAADTLSGDIPLLEEFIYFHRDVWNQKFGEVLDYIRQTHPDIEIGASTHLFESRGYLFNENITFLSGELNLGAKTTISELPTNIIVHLKGAEAVEKTLAYFPYPWEFDELRLQDAPRFGRGWVAQAYAYGGIFSIPANVWVGGDVWTWSPGADNYRDIYHLVSDQAHLLDNYKSYAKAGIVHAMYSSMKAGFIDGGNQIQSSVKLLTEENINFDMLVFGDAGYPVVPRTEDFEQFEQIFYDGDLNYLTPEQTSVLNQYNAVHVGQRGNYPELAITVSINGAVSNDTVSAISRIHESNANAPYVVHLLNRPFAGGVTPTLNGVEVAFPQNYFPASITSAKVHLPDGTSTNLTLSTNDNGDKVVTVNNIEVWGILELGH